MLLCMYTIFKLYYVCFLMLYALLVNILITLPERKSLTTNLISDSLFQQKTNKQKNSVCYNLIRFTIIFTILSDTITF